MGVEWKRMKWKNITVEVTDEEDIKFMDEIIDDLVVPFKILKSGSELMVSCCRKDYVYVADLRVPLVFKDYCSTQGCTTTVYIALPRDHPLRPLLRRAVEETWLETVKLVRILFYGEVFIRDVEFANNAELETVTVKCSDVFGKPVDRETVLQVPLGVLKRNLERVLRNKEKVLEIIRDTVRLVEEVEKQLASSKEVDVEFLERRLRRAYLSILKPGDELDVEF